MLTEASPSERSSHHWVRRRWRDVLSTTEVAKWKPHQAYADDGAARRRAATSRQLRVAEPTDALGNLRHTSSPPPGCGTTLSTPTTRTPVARADRPRRRVQWMPLADFGPQHFHFAALNSTRRAARRAAAGVVLNGNYRAPRRVVASVPRGRAGAVGGRARRAPRRRLRVRRTPRVAEARDCAAPAAGARLRAFAGDNARYGGGRAAGAVLREQP